MMSAFGLRARMDGFAGILGWLARRGREVEGAKSTVSGAIGLIVLSGRVTPHFCRLIAGTEHERLLPVSALASGVGFVALLRFDKRH
jgi:ABC-type cobalamin transport system permease subunit